MEILSSEEESLLESIEEISSISASEENEESSSIHIEHSDNDSNHDENEYSSSFIEESSETSAEDGFHYLHNFKLISTKDPTCTEQGENKFECTVCFVEKTEDFPSNGHAPKTIDGYEPTCQKEGLTDGIICEICEEMLTKQEIVKTVEHDVDGFYYTCKWCDYFDNSCLGFEKINNTYVCTGIELGAKWARRVTIPDTYNGLPVVGISSSAFTDHKELLYIELGTNIEYIAANAFVECQNLVEVYDRSKKQITLLEMSKCGYLTAYAKRIQTGEIKDFKSWVIKDENGYIYYDEEGDGIGERIFVGYDGTSTTLVLPNGITRIKSYAFCACNTVRSIVLPKSLIYIDPYAFDDVPLLETIVFEESSGWTRSSSRDGEYSAYENIFDEPRESATVLTNKPDKYYWYKREE